MQRKCRLCLTRSSELTSIWTYTDDTVKSLQECIVSFFGIEVKPQDPFPSEICKNCIKIIKCITTFRDDFQHNQKLLEHELKMKNPNRFDIPLQTQVLLKVDILDNTRKLKDLKKYDVKSENDVKVEISHPEVKAKPQESHSPYERQEIPPTPSRQILMRRKKRSRSYNKQYKRFSVPSYHSEDIIPSSHDRPSSYMCSRSFCENSGIGNEYICKTFKSRNRRSRSLTRRTCFSCEYNAKHGKMHTENSSNSNTHTETNLSINTKKREIISKCFHQRSNSIYSGNSDSDEMSASPERARSLSAGNAHHVPVKSTIGSKSADNIMTLLLSQWSSIEKLYDKEESDSMSSLCFSEESEEIFVCPMCDNMF